MESSTDLVGEKCASGALKETSPLLPRQSLYHKYDKQTVKPQKSTRSLPVEVVLILYFTATMAVVPIEQLYVHDRIKRKYLSSVLSEVINRTTVHNVSNTLSLSHTCSPNGSEMVNSTNSIVQSEAVAWLLLLTLSENICATVATTILGAFIDRRGRKLGIVVPICGSIIKIAICIAVVKYDLSLFVLLLADILEGSSGYYGTVYSAVLACLADVTATTRQRSFRITVALALNGIFIGLTYLAAGYVIEISGFLYPLLFSMTISTVTLPLTIAFFPETIASTGSGTFNICELRGIFSSFTLYTKDSPDNRRWKLRLFAAAFLGYNLVLAGKGNVQTLYQLNSPFCWSPTKIGIFGAAQTIGQQVFTLLFFRPLRCFISETQIAILGCVSAMGATLLQGFARTDLMMFMVTVVGAFQMLVPPTVKTMMSSLVQPREQGAVFASTGIIQMFCSCVAQIIFNSLYAGTLNVFPGATFLAMSGFFFLSVVFLVIAHVGMEEASSD